jgi:hypothetical protein
LLTNELPRKNSGPYAAVSGVERATVSVNLLHAPPLGGCAMGEARKNLRDELAGQALGGLLAGPNAPKRSKSESPQQYALRLAEEAYLYAEAMLKKRVPAAGDEEAPGADSPRQEGRPATVRISGNWRNPAKMEWAGTPALDASGRLECAAGIPEEVYQAVEQEIARGGREGTTYLKDGARVDWFVDR